jgi:hypothetical protein
VWLAGQAGGASAAAWTHVPHHVSWCGPSLHVSHFPNQIESSNCCPALLPALVERHTWRRVSPDIKFLSWGVGREYWMIYRVLGFLVVIWFGSSPPLPRSSASCPFLSVFLSVAGRAHWRERGDGGGGGAKSYDGEKAWSSINHSILSALTNRLNLIHNSARSHPLG